MLEHPETILIFHEPSAEFNCVWNALFVYLCRKPFESDLKLLSTKPDKRNSNRLILFYNKKRIGEIRLKHKLGMADPFRVSFTPLSILN